MFVDITIYNIHIYSKLLGPVCLQVCVYTIGPPAAFLVGLRDVTGILEMEFIQLT
jgi:hypothetical protein